MTHPPPKHKDMLLRQSEVDYTTVSPETGVRQCANCRWFCASGWDNASNSPTGAHCQIVEGYPLAILPTGLCNRHEILPADANEFPPMEVVIVDVEINETEIEMQVTPVAAKEQGVLRVFRKAPPATLIYKAAEDGLRRMVVITSNGYKDREDEHVATKALERYVKESYNDQDEYIGANKHLFYHKLDIGDVISADVIGGFLVEVTRERADSPLAAKIWDYIERTSADKSVTWGASHGFRAKRNGDTYEQIDKKETTTLDVEDAANLGTLSGVLS
jgi:hypothetical protein